MAARHRPPFDIRQYAKAVIAFIAPGVVLLVAAVTEGSPGGSTITGPEWLTAAAACVLTSAGVLATRNRPAPAPPPA